MGRRPGEALTQPNPTQPPPGAPQTAPNLQTCIVGPAVHTQGGTYTRRYTQKAVCSSAGVLLFKGGAEAGPRVERSEPNA